MDKNKDSKFAWEFLGNPYPIPSGLVVTGSTHINNQNSHTNPVLPIEDYENPNVIRSKQVATKDKFQIDPFYLLFIF
jgi:hypothetical protein